ncbi:cell envelope-associated transcriptional attenuator LytR-CpsA-Psr [Gracilibacillus boraciitolerans JCM 21714]|uniref:Cell envelope-associated transcriptional attenuator LytR-CpsA-Psr n=1 Tax=Gracilibacillus boraciitolerans JCM 21714 TaxID=1298598 RepID=W4VKY6_9BACI|nr:LCP family protein [Gracilibacillus boraciitolerans]GAE93414.1 cell envelope-associated transcriptional attenuator LytR-CpsA-Psr [Gracilibacillus boraciitolerans JCM 21714]
MEKRTKRKKTKKWWILTPLIILFVIILVVGGYILSIINNVEDTFNTKMHEPIESIDTEKAAKKTEDAKPLNILLLGVDQRGDDPGRSDALMVLSLKPNKEEMQLISIPRDTRTLIVGRSTEDKINHAYAFGGPDMAVQTVENFLDVELDYFVRINMEGLKELVDELGGTITVDNEIEWSDGNYQFTKGPVEMDGNKTLAYVRMRKQDPQGDFGRTERQRKVIQAIINEGANVGNVTKVHDVIGIMGNNMASSLNFDNMKSLLNNYRSTRKNVTSYLMEGSGETIDGIYYYIVPDEEVAKVREMIIN